MKVKSLCYVPETYTVLYVNDINKTGAKKYFTIQNEPQES